MEVSHRIRTRLRVQVERRHLSLWECTWLNRQDDVLFGRISTADSNDRSTFPGKRIPSRINGHPSRLIFPRPRIRVQIPTHGGHEPYLDPLGERTQYVRYISWNSQVTSNRSRLNTIWKLPKSIWTPIIFRPLHGESKATRNWTYTLTTRWDLDTSISVDVPQHQTEWDIISTTAATRHINRWFVTNVIN